MEEILKIANTVSPLGVIALCIVVIYQLVRNTGIIQKLRGTQMDDKSTVSNKVATDAIDMAVLNNKLDLLASNHLHELPRLVQVVDRIETELNTQGNRLIRVETKLEMLNK